MIQYWQKHLYQQIIKKSMWQHNNANKNLDYKAIQVRLRTVRWSSVSHQTGVD